MSELSSNSPEKSQVEVKKPRRGRPPKIDPAHILKVAREVFLARGIRATTSEVAERAGVSEGSIFYRFKSKEGLFREAMQLSEGEMPRLLIDAVDALEGKPLEESLITLAHALVDIARTGLPLMMMSWSNPSHHASCAQDANAQKFREFIKRLAVFFEVHMEAGTVRRTDSEVIARTFLGTIHHYCMGRMFADEYKIHIMPEEMFIRGHVELLLYGALANQPQSESPYTRHLA